MKTKQNDRLGYEPRHLTDHNLAAAIQDITKHTLGTDALGALLREQQRRRELRARAFAATVAL